MKARVVILRLLTFIFVLIIGELSSYAASNDMATEFLSKKAYTDPDGYFLIIPPAGWKIHRGKVAFLGPEQNVDVRVLARAADYKNVDEMISAFKQTERKFGTNTNIKKVTFNGQEAVERNFVLQGLKILYIDFLIAGVKHNLAYDAPLNIYEKYLPAAKASLDTYVSKVRETSAEMVTEHLVAKCISLARSMILQKNYSTADEFVNEGLAQSPSNPELLTLKKQIEDQRKGKASISWSKFENPRFTIAYPANWIIREQGKREDEFIYAFKDNSPTMGAIIVMFVPQQKIFGKSNNHLSMNQYKEAVSATSNVQGNYVGDVQSNGMKGKRFTATRTLFNRPAEFLIDVYPYGEYVCVVTGFFRPDNAKQKELIYQSAESLKLDPTNITTR